MQPWYGFFEWFYEETKDNMGKFLMSRLEKLDKKIEELQMDVNKVKVSSEEIRMQLNKMIKMEKCWIMMLVVMCLVMWFFMY